MKPVFVTPVGTFSNASGLPQVPAGSKKIPQSLLNNVGRAIDSSRIVPSQGITIERTPGGTGLDISAIIEAAAGAKATLLPFQVIPTGVTSTKIQCVIGEGRIFGRVDWDAGDYYPGTPNEAYNIPSLGVSAVDPSFSGVWPSEDPVPDTTGSGGGSKNPQGQTTVDDTKTGGGSGTYHTPLDDSLKGNAGYVSGNAGSITSKGQQGGTYHTPLSVTGNGGYISGNAGSVTNPGRGSSGIYHTPLRVTGNGDYISGNAGSVTSSSQQNGIYHTQVKSGNAFIPAPTTPTP